jgi:aspartate racemase
MKLIGLLGGMGWQSTIDYYRTLNQQVHKKLGKNHSARVILLSPDYEDIKQYNYEQIQERGEILLNELLELSSSNPDCILICNNTLHKVYDEIKPHLYIETPIFHIVDLVGEHLARQRLNNVLLLGTQFTMEDGFFEQGLKKHGVSCVIPPSEIRRDMQKMHDKLLVQGPDEEMTVWHKKLIQEYIKDVDAVVLACTELPLIVSQKDFEIPIIDTVELHCTSAIDFALA